jgi:hypothetical protein
MAASNHLSPKLFHGSAHMFNPGDTVNPVPKNEWHHEMFGSFAYATNNQLSAQNYASQKAQEKGQLFAPVYEVAPVDSTEHTEYPNNNGANASPKEFAERGTSHAVHSKKGFKVIKQHGWGTNPDAYVMPEDRLWDTP